MSSEHPTTDLLAQIRSFETGSLKKTAAHKPKGPGATRGASVGAGAGAGAGTRATAGAGTAGVRVSSGPTAGARPPSSFSAKLGAAMAKRTATSERRTPSAASAAPSHATTVGVAAAAPSHATAVGVGRELTARSGAGGGASGAATSAPSGMPTTSHTLSQLDFGDGLSGTESPTADGGENKPTLFTRTKGKRPSTRRTGGRKHRSSDSKATHSTGDLNETSRTLSPTAGGSGNAEGDMLRALGYGGKPTGRGQPKTRSSSLKTGAEADSHVVPVDHDTADTAARALLDKHYQDRAAVETWRDLINKRNQYSAYAPPPYRSADEQSDNDYLPGSETSSVGGLSVQMTTLGQNRRRSERFDDTPVSFGGGLQTPTKDAVGVHETKEDGPVKDAEEPATRTRCQTLYRKVYNGADCFLTYTDKTLNYVILLSIFNAMCPQGGFSSLFDDNQFASGWPIEARATFGFIVFNAVVWGKYAILKKYSPQNVIRNSLRSARDIVTHPGKTLRSLSLRKLLKFAYVMYSIVAIASVFSGLASEAIDNVDFPDQGVKGLLGKLGAAKSVMKFFENRNLHLFFMGSALFSNFMMFGNVLQGPFGAFPAMDRALDKFVENDAFKEKQADATFRARLALDKFRHLYKDLDKPENQAKFYTLAARMGVDIINKEDEEEEVSDQEAFEKALNNLTYETLETWKADVDTQSHDGRKATGRTNVSVAQDRQYNISYGDDDTLDTEEADFRSYYHTQSNLEYVLSNAFAIFCVGFSIWGLSNFMPQAGIAMSYNEKRYGSVFDATIGQVLKFGQDEHIAISGHAIYEWVTLINMSLMCVAIVPPAALFFAHATAGMLRAMAVWQNWLKAPYNLGAFLLNALIRFPVRQLGRLCRSEGMKLKPVTYKEIRLSWYQQPVRMISSNAYIGLVSIVVVGMVLGGMANAMQEHLIQKANGYEGGKFINNFHIVAAIAASGLLEIRTFTGLIADKLKGGYSITCWGKIRRRTCYRGPLTSVNDENDIVGEDAVVARRCLDKIAERLTLMGDGMHPAVSIKKHAASALYKKRQEAGHLTLPRESADPIPRRYRQGIWFEELTGARPLISLPRKQYGTIWSRKRGEMGNVAACTLSAVAA